MIGSSDGTIYENEFHHALGIEKPVTPPEVGSRENNAPQASTAPSSQSLTVIRHGGTNLNEGEDKERFRGWSSVGLHDDGIEDAYKTAESIKDKGLTSLVSSDLPRAKQTANIIGRELGITPTFNPNLRTWDMGELTGKPVEDHQDTCQEHIVDKPDVAIPGGESFNEFKNRTLLGVSESMKSDPGGKVGIVTHNSPERILAAWDKAGQPEDGSIHTGTYMEEGEKPGGSTDMKIGPSIHDIQSMTHPDEQQNTAKPVLDFLNEYRKGGLLHAIMGESEPAWSQKLHSFAQGIVDAAGVSSPFIGAMRLLPRSASEPGGFRVLNEEGKTVGSLDTSYNKSSKVIHVGMASTSLESPLKRGSAALEANPHAHALGLRETSNLMYALKEEYPEAEWVEGFRISGSRSSSGPVSRTGGSSIQLVKMPKKRRPLGNEPIDPEFEKELADIVKTVKPTIPSRRNEPSMEELGRLSREELSSYVRTGRMPGGVTEEEMMETVRQALHSPSRMEQQPFVDSRSHSEWSNLSSGQPGAGHTNARRHSETVPYDVEVRGSAYDTRYRNGQEIDF